MIGNNVAPLSGRRRRPAFPLALLIAGIFGAAATAAEAPSGAAILHDLRRLATVGSVLHIAAHPDDENTQLITYLVRGRGYRTGYLSITRGDGGQNELGPDFDEKLGVLRTQELLAARRLDGGEQFFTRAIDFGYSKSPEETLQFWHKEQVLGDVVRVIRKFRPDVVITRFPIPPGSGGHGHHTASAMLAVEAFKLAADPKAYPEQLEQGLEPWQPKRILWNGFGGRGGSALNGPTVRIDIAGNDPITGESFASIASRSIGMHKTQGVSRRGPDGPNLQTFMLLAGEPVEKDIVDGIDTTWSRIPDGEELGRSINEAIAQFNANAPAASVPALLAIRAKLDAAASNNHGLDHKRAELDRILQACLGLKIETTVAQPEVVPGEEIEIAYAIALNSDVPVSFGARGFRRATALPRPQHLRADVAAKGTFMASLPKDISVTQPYWLREESAAGIARVADPTLIGRPENPPALPVEYEFEVGGQKLRVVDQPVFMAKDANGKEKRQPLEILSPVAVSFVGKVSVLAPSGAKSVEVDVVAARANTKGALRLEVPSDWKTSPVAQSFSLMKAGDKARLTFTVTAPKQSTAARMAAHAEIEGKRYSHQRIDLNYAHLPPQLLQPPARARLVSAEVATKGKHLGYLPGAGDDTAAALEQLGYTVTMLSGADLNAEKLGGLDAVVIGVRAFNERNDLAANLTGLFAYVENGGTVIAQYNRPNGLQAQMLGPYSLSIAGPAPQQRVTDEKSPVEFLAPDHPVLNVPNKIAPADFEGWVQERGAYFPSKWDEERYTPVLAFNDPGEQPLKSGVLIARHGKGYYVYTGLAFFRQLPAGVPGAYRLFANLVSLGK